MNNFINLLYTDASFRGKEKSICYVRQKEEPISKVREKVPNAYSRKIYYFKRRRT
jgi:hypothetical protein